MKILKYKLNTHFNVKSDTGSDLLEKKLGS